MKRFDPDENQQAVSSLQLADSYLNRISLDGKQLVNQTFRWYHGGSEVWLYGDFNNWEGQQMQKKVKHTSGQMIVVFKLMVPNLESGKYQFSYLVDGQWRNRPDLKLSDSINPITKIKNHVVFISSHPDSSQYISTKQHGLLTDESPIMQKRYMTTQGNEVI